MLLSRPRPPTKTTNQDHQPRPPIKTGYQSFLFLIGIFSHLLLAPLTRRIEEKRNKKYYLSNIGIEFMKSNFLTLLATVCLFILKLGLYVGILLGLLSLYWIITSILSPSSPTSLQGVSTPLGQVWFSYHAYSLNLSQSIIQRFLFPWVWEYLFIPTLKQPMWLFCTLVLGGNLVGLLVTSYLSRRR